MLSCQLLRFGDYCAVENINGRTKSPETFQMLVNGPASDIAASGKRNFRCLVFSKQCAQKIVGRSDLLDVFVFHADVGYGGTCDLNLCGLILSTDAPISLIASNKTLMSRTSGKFSM